MTAAQKKKARERLALLAAVIAAGTSRGDNRSDRAIAEDAVGIALEIVAACDREIP